MLFPVASYPDLIPLKYGIRSEYEANFLYHWGYPMILILIQEAYLADLLAHQLLQCRNL